MPIRRSLLPGLLLAAALAWPCAARALELGADYSLTRPVPVVPVAPVMPQLVLPAGGVSRLGMVSPASGGGLSLQAGERWFARVGLGRSLDRDVVALGGGYRFADGGALSMQVTRQLGQGRLGLAVRYDWTHSYLRLAYDTQPSAVGGADTLRFSAGVRF